MTRRPREGGERRSNEVKNERRAESISYSNATFADVVRSKQRVSLSCSRFLHHTVSRNVIKMSKDE